jgi:arginyl-tRNA synthetase
MNFVMPALSFLEAKAYLIVYNLKAIMDPYQHAKEEITRSIALACKEAGYPAHLSAILNSLDDSKKGFGDIACTLAFDLAKSEKRNPRDIATEIVRRMPQHELISKCEVAGAYVNIYLSPAFVKLAIDSCVEDGKRYGSKDQNNKVVYIEFPSVNPNKPWHIGHLRNAILGDSVSRLLRFTGFDVKNVDYIDDLGLQVAQSVWGYLNLSNKVDMKTDQWLGRQYVEVAKRMEETEVDRQVREIVVQMEHGGNDVSEIARKLCERCVQAQYETAFRLGIYHELMVWESDLVHAKALDHAIEKAKESGAVRTETEGKNKGCLVAPLSGNEEFANMESPDKILMRSDGTATYVAKDLSFVLWKFGLSRAHIRFSQFMDQPNGAVLFTSVHDGKHERLPAAQVAINVIGVEQKYPQRVLSLLLEAMGYSEQASNYVHLAYEHAWLPDKKFSGREGSWVGNSADELLDEAESRALNEIRARFKDMGEDERAKIARAVGIGAVRFDMVKTTPEKKIVFRWEEALNFEGDSAPYVQYSHARSCRILEKAGESLFGNALLLTAPEEHKLSMLIAHFPHIVSHAALDMRPHEIAGYLLEVSSQFSSFYAACPVLTAQPALMAARLKLVRATQIVLRNGLSLLGVEAPERM